MLKTLFEHPLTKGLDPDAPLMTIRRRRIILEKSFLHQLYQEWYSMIIACLPPGEGSVLELGSGGGFLSRELPGVISSEIMLCPDMDIILNGEEMPLVPDSLRAIVMTDVLHHLPRPRQFFAEAMRCLRPGGVVVMIEPWVTNWSRFVYRQLHPEPFQPQVKQWEFASKGALSDANSALPWMIFERDRAIFEKEFSRFQIEQLRLLMPGAYLFSGGVSLRGSAPGWSYRPVRLLEKLLAPLNRFSAMFALIVIRKKLETE